MSKCVYQYLFNKQVLYKVKGGGTQAIYFRGAPFIGEVSGDRIGPKWVQGSAQYGTPRESFTETLGN